VRGLADEAEHVVVEVMTEGSQSQARVQRNGEGHDATPPPFPQHGKYFLVALLAWRQIEQVSTTSCHRARPPPVPTHYTPIMFSYRSKTASSVPS
jgi:hypothetical protein